jgi:gentisate 1,2-dioxygenase
MPTYADTPKWKSRDAYLDSTPAPKKVKTNPLAVECPTCNAARRLPCHNIEGKMCRPHRSRWWKAQQAAKARARTQRQTRARQRERWEGVKIRYVCPLCGGAHPRAEHHGARPR